MQAKFKIGQSVYENERYYTQGRSQFGRELKRFNGEKVIKSFEIEGVENPIFYELSNGLHVNQCFLSENHDASK